jgi:hypothetical protein
MSKIICAAVAAVVIAVIGGLMAAAVKICNKHIPPTGR